jgi:hypothetical protein
MRGGCASSRGCALVCLSLRALIGHKLLKRYDYLSVCIFQDFILLQYHFTAYEMTDSKSSLIDKLVNDFGRCTYQRLCAGSRELQV